MVVVMVAPTHNRSDTEIVDASPRRTQRYYEEWWWWWWLPLPPHDHPNTELVILMVMVPHTHNHPDTEIV